MFPQLGDVNMLRHAVSASNTSSCMTEKLLAPANYTLRLQVCMPSSSASLSRPARLLGRTQPALASTQCEIWVPVWQLWYVH